MARIQAGKVDEALAILSALVQADPADGRAHALIGVSHAQQGNLEGAVKSLETAALLSPHDPGVEYNLAEALFRAGRKDEAVWRLTRLTETNPEDQEAKALLEQIRRSSAAGAAAAAPASAGTQAAFAGSRPGAAAPAAGIQPHYRAASSGLTGAPGVGLRLLRGVGWGLLYAQSWTVFSLFGAVFISLLTTRVEHAIIALIILGALTVLFHSAMGVLTGVVVALMNADEDMGGWVGMSVGFLILLIALRAGFLAFFGVVFYIFVGRWIGRSVAGLVQRPVAA